MKCELCGKEFETLHGLNVHKGRIHKSQSNKKIKNAQDIDLLSVIFKAVGIIIFFSSLVSFIAGNGLLGLLFLSTIVLWLIIGAFAGYFFIGRSSEGEKQKRLNIVLAGCGIFLFAVITYVVSVPFLVYDGTESCSQATGFPLQLDGNHFTVTVNGIEARLFGDRLTRVRIATKVLSEEKVICKQCDTDLQLKPDKSSDPIASKTQYSDFTITLPISVQKFYFAQQVFNSDGVVPFISDVHNFARSCDCNVLLEEGTIVCVNAPPDLLRNLTIGAGNRLFSPTPNS